MLNHNENFHSCNLLPRIFFRRLTKVLPRSGLNAIRTKIVRTSLVNFGTDSPSTGINFQQ